MDMTVPMLALSGGPNAGRTTVLNELHRHFTGLGYTVAFVNDSAAALTQQGQGPHVVGMKRFQEDALALQDQHEKYAQRRVARARRPLIITDGSVIDIAAYMPPSTHAQAVGTATGESFSHARDARYAGGVIHLESTAVDCSDTFVADCVEYEDQVRMAIESAQEIDQSKLAAWMGTPKLAYVRCAQQLEDKVAEAIAYAESFVLGMEHERKFKLLVPFDEAQLPEHAERIHIQQSYVRLPDTERYGRIRLRACGGEFLYQHSMKQKVRPGVSQDTERFIPHAEYERLYEKERVRELPQVIKHRWHFVENGQYWHLDVFPQLPGLAILEAELPNMDWPVSLPAWLEGHVEEVTGIDGYYAKGISLRMKELLTA